MEMDQRLSPEYTGSEITSDSPDMSIIDHYASEFKNKYGELSKKYIELIDLKKSFALQVQSLIDGRSNLISQLGSEVIAKYPDVKSDVSILKTISTLAPDHPVLIIWGKYKDSIQEFDQKIAQVFKKYKETFEDIQLVQDDMMSIESEYDQKQSEISQDYPSTTELIKAIAPNEPVDTTDDSTILEKVTALDLIDKDAALTISSEVNTMIDPSTVPTLQSQVVEKKPVNKGLLFGAAAVLYYLFN